jgi:hypothetical protein
VVSDGGQQGGADAGHAIQPLEAAERATGASIGDDAFREARPDSREPGNLCRARPVDIDPLARAERAGQSYGAVFVGKRRLGRERLDQLDLARRLAGAGNHEPHRVTSDRETKE